MPRCCRRRATCSISQPAHVRASASSPRSIAERARHSHSNATNVQLPPQYSVLRIHRKFVRVFQMQEKSTRNRQSNSLPADAMARSSPPRRQCIAIPSGPSRVSQYQVRRTATHHYGAFDGNSFELAPLLICGTERGRCQRVLVSAMYYSYIPTRRIAVCPGIAGPAPILQTQEHISRQHYRELFTSVPLLFIVAGS